jgi:SpoVK/Ycf46/Vps4 family AAA+-type ATPase
MRAALIALRILASGLVDLRLERRGDLFLAMVADYLSISTVVGEHIRKRINELDTDWDQKPLSRLSTAQYIKKVIFDSNMRDGLDLESIISWLAKSERRLFLQLLNDSADTLASELELRGAQTAPEVMMLRELLQLGEIDTALLSFAHAILVSSSGMINFLSCCTIISPSHACDAVALALGLHSGFLSNCLSEKTLLESLRLIEIDRSPHDLYRFVGVSEIMNRLLRKHHDTGESMLREVTSCVQPATLSSDDFPHLTSEIDGLVRFLSGAAATSTAGVNVLIYGEPGTGKTELAKVLATRVQCQFYQVSCKDDNGDSSGAKERFDSLRFAQIYLKASPNCLIMFDEAEDVFPVNEVWGPRRTAGKAWVNELLETNPVPVIWISNKIDQMDPAYLRRFQYHLEVRKPPLEVRERILASRFGDLDVSSEFVQRLARSDDMTPAMIGSAALFARLSGAKSGSDLESLVDYQLKASCQALGKKLAPAETKVVTTYDLQSLNVDCQFPVERIIQALGRSGSGSLCFHGVSGSGKTALAQHITRQLNKKLMVRMASDLLDMYLGGTEKRINAMFREAGENGSVLLLDEADSFLRDRRGAQRSWEVTQVNELLQQIERFQGIFICTTNLFRDLDQAVLRRFTFKIEFHPLNAEQRERMFVREALQGEASRINAAMRHRLNALDHLTPGDFATVMRQANLLGEVFEATAFLDQLEQEHAAKLDSGTRKPMGFMA